jgi:Ca2+-transporting ATPase
VDVKEGFLLTARAKDVLLEYKTRETGLFPVEVQKRLQKYGKNSIEEKNVNGFWQMLSHQFTDLMVIILLVAGTLALIFSSYRDAGIMFLIVAVNASIGFFQEFKVEKTLLALSKLLPKKVRVIRANKELEIMAELVVPGDIVILSSGEDIPADAIIIDSFGLKVDESTLTGESRPVDKYSVSASKITDSNYLFMGTSILDGSAKAIASKTSLNTRFGQIAEATTKIKEDFSPLQKKLNKMSKFIARLAMVILIVFVLFGIATGKDLVSNFLFALALAAAVVPEGLPATISVALSLAASRLAKKNALIKKLTSTESLGAATVICTDKTGTITEGRMVADTFWNLSQKETKIEKLKIDHLTILKNIFALCNNAGFVNDKLTGNYNEVSLLEYLVSKHVDFEKMRKLFPTIYEIPFTPERKMMSVVVKIEKDFWLLTKGQPDAVIAKSKFTKSDRLATLQAEAELSGRALHNLSFAYKNLGKSFKINKKLSTGEINKLNLKLESNLQFIGILGLLDPVKKGVLEATQQCHDAGIRIMMVTGDTKSTALAVGRKINFFGSHHERIFIGDEIDKMSDVEFRSVLQKNVIFAEVDPEHKLKIVDNLQALGDIVAVTGDGVNDAPALKKADIGVAMGKKGTDVAKEAADMILLDDNFATIVRAIYEGRTIFENIQKIIYYVLAGNSGELLVVLIGILLRTPLPIIAVQILAIDLGTEVLPAISLVKDRGDDDLMHHASSHRRTDLLDKTNLTKLITTGLIMGIGANLSYYLLGRFGFDYAVRTTASYATIVICQIVSLFMTHLSFKGYIFSKRIFSNPYLILGQIVSIILLILIIYFQPFQYALQTGPLNLTAWMVPILSALTLGVVGQLFFMKKEAALH